jgi:hypothetical protein
MPLPNWRELLDDGVASEVCSEEYRLASTKVYHASVTGRTFGAAATTGLKEKEMALLPLAAAGGAAVPLRWAWRWLEALDIDAPSLDGWRPAMAGGRDCVARRILHT